MGAEEQEIDLTSLTIEEEDAILERVRSEFGLQMPFKTLEELITHEDGFGLTTATALQRAILRILEGRPLADLAKNKMVQRAIGGADLPDFEFPPIEVDVLAAVRCGKSMFAAGIAIWASQKCDLSMLSQGEIPRYSIISLEKDNATVVFSHLLGALQKPALIPFRVPDKTSSSWRELIDESGVDTIGSEFLWHPSGRPVEIRVVAGKRAGGSVVSRWSLGVCLDEAPRMAGENESVINYNDTRRGARTRLLPGAQIFSIGSPWRAIGPIYQRYTDHFGRPTDKRVIIKATGPAMNPYWWTPERCEEIRQEDPEAYKTDVLAEFLEPLEALLNPSIINECTRKEPLHIPYEAGHSYEASMDPATRGNAWTFAICDRTGSTKRVVFHKEWQGTTLEPLKPRSVLVEIADYLKEYNLESVYTDQWSADAIVDIAEELFDPSTGKNISFTVLVDEWSVANKTRAYMNVRDGMADGKLELPPDEKVITDFRMIRKRATRSGFSIELPKTGDKRHCDYAPTIVRLFGKWLEDVEELPPDESDIDAFNKWNEEQMELAEIEEFEIKNDINREAGIPVEHNPFGHRNPWRMV